MKIISLELIGYKRLSLNKIERIKVNLEEKMQLIIGTNGVGKSSILSELSPLPASKSDFKPGGSKRIMLEHNDKSYTLLSQFDKGAKHSFVRDREELNVGGTGAVQKQLVMKEFNIDTNIHDLCLGRKSFRMMSLVERRGWFTKMSTNNYDYALEVFFRLKEKLKATQNIVKYNHSRLAQESSKVLSEKEEKALRKRIGLAKSSLDFLLKFKNMTLESKDYLEKELESTMYNIDIISKDIIRKKSSLDATKIDFDEIEADIVSLKNAIRDRNSVISKIGKDIEDNSEILSRIAATDCDVKDLEMSKDSIQKEISALSSNIRTIFRNDMPNVVEILSEVKSALESIISPLYEYPSADLKSSSALKDKLNMLEESLHTQRAILGRYRRDSDDIVSALEKLERDMNYSDLKECPNCGYDLKDTKGHAEYKAYSESLEIKNREIEEVERHIKEFIGKGEKIRDIIDVYRNFYKYTNLWPCFKDIWEYIIDNNLLREDPRKISMLLGDVIYDLKLRNTKIKPLEIELDTIQSSIKAFRENNIKHKRDLESQISADNELLHNNQTVQTENRREVEYLSHIRKQYKELKDLAISLEKNLTRIVGLRDKLVNIKSQDVLNKGIMDIKLRLTEMETSLSRIDNQNNLVSNIKKELDVGEEELESLKILVKELSPTDGLIAEGLLNFITTFTNELNVVISRIWSYPLEILPPKLEESSGEVALDYKFPVRINGDNEISDISKASSAMCEVIDLAFRIVSSKYLKLKDYPIYLDEFGHSFDTAHRESAYSIIDTILDSDDFSQVFLISHYENCYGSFKNADLIVLSEENINLPKGLVPNSNVLFNY